LLFFALFGYSRFTLFQSLQSVSSVNSRTEGGTRKGKRSPDRGRGNSSPPPSASGGKQEGSMDANEMSELELERQRALLLRELQMAGAQESRPIDD